MNVHLTGKSGHSLNILTMRFEDCCSLDLIQDENQGKSNDQMPSRWQINCPSCSLGCAMMFNEFINDSERGKDSVAAKSVTESKLYTCTRT